MVAPGHSVAPAGPTKTPLDREDISLEDTLNQLLVDDLLHPDLDTVPGSVSKDPFQQLEMLQLAIRGRIHAHRQAILQLQTEIDTAQSQNRMTQAQELIAELFTQIHHLRTGATESEAIVREITRDIKTLDLAKKNIVASITGIKRFQMLVVAFDQLQRQAKGKRYKETAHALSAVKELANHFRSFSSIERIANLLKGIQEVQGTMRSQVMKDFETALGKGGRDVSLLSNPEGISLSQLSDACLVVDAIGADAKQSLLEYYCSQILREYRRIFRPTEEAGQLDNLPRRFAWFKRVIKMNEEELTRVFPQEWNVVGCLCGAFSAVTKDDLKSVLVRVASGLNVSRLLEALNAATEFENEMAKKLNMPFDRIAALSPITHGATINSISSAFEPYLGIFVDAQDKTLSDMITSWRNSPGPAAAAAATAKDGRPGQEGDNNEAGHMTAHTILPSSTELFYFYKETLGRCAKLNNRNTLLELSNVFRKWLKVYAEEVLGGFLSRPDRRSNDGRLNQSAIVQACTIINTAEYCAETTGQLEDSLKKKIHPDFTDRISMEQEKELFATVTSTAILALLKELELACDPAFNAMLRSPWGPSQQSQQARTVVSSESAYVVDLTAAINHVVEIVRGEIEHRKYFRSFCDKAVGLIITKFTQTIVRARPISTIGAEQILLDLQRLKSCLLQLPRLPGEGTGSSTALASYNRVVAKAISRIDIMLQVIMFPSTPNEEFVDHYLILIPCQSFGDFQKILDLKGINNSRKELNNLLDLFLAKTSLLRDLSDTSILTGIEMDGSSGAGPFTAGTTSHASGLSSNSLTPGSGSGGGGGALAAGLGLGFPGGLHLPTTSPNSALAHNLNLLMGSLPILQGAGGSGGSGIGGSKDSGSGQPTRSGTPQLVSTGSFSSNVGGAAISGLVNAGAAGVAGWDPGPTNRAFGFKKIGRLFSKDSSSNASVRSNE